MALGSIFLKADSVCIGFKGPAIAKHRRPHNAAAAVGGRVITTKRGSTISAISDVSFELAAGDRLALLGHNGAGKTTLLRLLAGIFMPSSGTISHGGSLGNALNVNLGFRNEATGRRNIVLKGLMSGKKHAEMEQFIEEVAHFAQLGSYLDAPFSTYSAGMRARLAFGIATSVRKDILLLDEWLGAGDQTMRQRAEQRMQDLVNGSSIIVLATHNKGILSQVCNKGLVLNHGQMDMFGSLDDALHRYQQLIEESSN